jgi:cell division protein FtsB
VITAGGKTVMKPASDLEAQISAVERELASLEARRTVLTQLNGNTADQARRRTGGI